MNFENKIKTLITSPQISADALDSLRNMGVEVLFSCESPNVLPPLKYHADMQITGVGSGKMICAPECYDYYCNILKNKDIKILAGDTILTSNYPGDIAYNIIVDEKFAIHNFRHTDSVILQNLGERKKINVSQGYTACTLCVVGENAFITSDRGIYSVLLGNGADVLLTNDNCIRLEGFDHGFFGGASVMLSPGVMAVNGCLESHPDYIAISSFCKAHGVDIISLSSDIITDIGSFISCE